MERNYVAYLTYFAHLTENDRKTLHYGITFIVTISAIIFFTVPKMRIPTIIILMLYLIAISVLRRPNQLHMLRNRLILRILTGVVLTIVILGGTACLFGLFFRYSLVFFVVAFVFECFLWWLVYSLSRNSTIKKNYKIKAPNATGAFPAGIGAACGTFGVVISRTFLRSTSNDTAVLIGVGLAVGLASLLSIFASDFVQLELFWKFPHLEQQCVEELNKGND